ncbi:MAG: outer membrane beta-barrel family protein [Taibaiella sp.]|jgi:hypothetical protein
MRKLFLSLSLCLFALTAYTQIKIDSIAQSRQILTISGSLKDTVNLTTTGYASVSLIRSADSILQTFTRTDELGNFKLNADSPGKYLLLIAHPSFAIYVDEVNVTKDKTELGTIIMISKKQMLQEVLITDARAIVMKGDTTEYTADSFKTRAFDNVDELLKKLPGIEVDRNGKIKAYGKEVKNMTVDGEEFFSDDPAVVAQTLRASSVDKVQVFDKKSDQAAFTGIDDGELTKTINLKLKDDAKRGYFGKISAGGGLPSFWENQAMINAFKKKRKIAAYGIMSNTNTNGLGWEESRNYGGGGRSFSQDDDGSWVMEGGDGDDDYRSWGGQFGGEGLPKTWKGGVNYNNKWMGDTLSFNANYKYGKSVTEGVNNTRTQYILPDTQYVYEDNASNTSISQNHNINTVTEYIIDTSSSIKLTLGGKYSINDRSSSRNNKSVTMDGGLINTNNTLQQTRSESKGVNANLFYRKRFKKKGRTFSTEFTGNWSANDGYGTLNSDYTLFVIDSAYRIDQRKSNTGNSITGKIKFSYTEPLSKVANLELNYSLGLNNNESENNSFDKKAQGSEYTDVLNPLFSSHYIFNTMQNQGGANIRFNFKKVNFSFGTNISDNRFHQEDKLFDTTYSYSYLNILPRASFTFNKSQTTSLSFRYNGRTVAPQISQLQPLRNNNDPLNITIGNPDLKQSYNHRLSLNYNNYKVLSSRSIYADVSLTVIQNAISQQQFIDNTGRRTTQYVNVNGNYSLWSYAGYRTKILDFQTGLDGGVNFSHTNNFINGLPNVNNNLSLTPSLNIDYSKDTTFNISYRFNPAYNLNKSSIRTDVATKYWTFGQTLDGSINLPYNVRVGTEIDWNIRQRLDPQDKNNNVFRWNAYVSKSFLKNKSLVAKLYANDILDQNVGYTRYNDPNYISENTYNTIRRYFMLSLTWNFTKTGAKNTDEGNEVIIGED